MLITSTASELSHSLKPTGNMELPKPGIEDTQKELDKLREKRKLTARAALNKRNLSKLSTLSDEKLLHHLNYIGNYLAPEWWDIITNSLRSSLDGLIDCSRLLHKDIWVIRTLSQQCAKEMIKQIDDRSAKDRCAMLYGLLVKDFWSSQEDHRDFGQDSGLDESWHE